MRYGFTHPTVLHLNVSPVHTVVGVLFSSVKSLARANVASLTELELVFGPSTRELELLTIR